MVKTYRCPNCSANITFMPQTGMMHCEYCGKSYPTEEIIKYEKERGASSEQKQATVRMQILHCNSCGAELAYNGVEASSFCAYCGQSTVVLERVEECLKPDYILPFKITQEQAEKTIRKKLSSGFFVPKEIKKFTVDRLYGIYIPYWFYDIYYGDEQFWRYKEGKAERFVRSVSETRCRNLTIDASENLSNESSECLEPYDTGELVEFDPSYLSGFYSDRYDSGHEKTDAIAIERARKLFDKEVKDKLEYKMIDAELELDYSDPVYRIIGVKYAFLPAWFLTFRNEEKPYTIMVNGQTGKMVGSVPYDKKKTSIIFILLSLVASSPFLLFASILFINAADRIEAGNSESGFVLIGLFYEMFWLGSMALGGVFLIYKAIKKLKIFNASVKRTQSLRTNKYVKERQDK